MPPPEEDRGDNEGGRNLLILHNQKAVHIRQIGAESNMSQTVEVSSAGSVEECRSARWDGCLGVGEAAHG